MWVWEYGQVGPGAPQRCKAYPIAILLHGHCSIYAPPPTPPLYAIHHTLLVMAIWCKGQGSLSPETDPSNVPMEFHRVYPGCNLCAGLPPLWGNSKFYLIVRNLPGVSALFWIRRNTNTIFLFSPGWRGVHLR